MSEVVGIIFVFIVSALIAKVIHSSFGGNETSSSNYFVDSYTDCNSDNCNDFWDDCGCNDSWGGCDSDCGCDSDGGDCGCD